MAPLPSAEPFLDPGDAEVLLDLADGAVVDGLLGRRPGIPSLAVLSPSLRERLGVFATLIVDRQLNGCIGTVQGVEALGQGAARHAWSAAFADPRLPPLRPSDYNRLTIEVSVLSPLAPVEANSHQELVDQLQPGDDGLVITAGRHQGVFLPAVWDQIADPSDFLDHLLVKAGLPARWWPPAMRAYRFSAEKHVRRVGHEPLTSRIA